MDDINTQAETLVEEVKGSFDLGGFLKGAPTRFKTIRVYTDQEVGAELGGTRTQTGALGYVLGEERYGLIGETLDAGDELKALKAVDEAERTEAQDDRIDELTALVKANGAKVSELMKKLDESALDIEIQSLPPVIQKDADRRARLALGIKGNIPEAKQTDFNDRYEAELLSLATVSITKVATGERNVKLDPDDAMILVNHLPISEQRRIADALQEIVLRSGIADKLASNADFSQGI